MLRWIWPNLEFCYKNRTPGSDPKKGDLSMGNDLEVDLEKNSQRAQPILSSQVEVSHTYYKPQLKVCHFYD